MTKASAHAWKRNLVEGRNGGPKPLVANAMLAFRHAPAWKGVLAHDEFADEVVLVAPPPWNRETWRQRPWCDNDDVLGAEWLQREGIHVTPQTVGQAAEAVAKENSIHPVKAYLRGVEWDGLPRLDTWLAAYLRAPNTPYTRAIGARWFISAVARIFRPGCKADCVLILEGGQGVGKSSAVQALGGRWTTDRLSDLSSKDAALELRGVWIVELAELDGFRKSEVETIKAFVSRTEDKYRSPYARHVQAHPRQCVFIGTVNPVGGYLRDATGGRRFWPVECGRVEREALEADRDQLWAEAVVRFEAGDRWWPDTPELNALIGHEQKARYEADVWTSAVAAFVQGREFVTVEEILRDDIMIEKAKLDQHAKRRIEQILTALGWTLERTPRTSDPRRPRRYRAPFQATLEASAGPGESSKVVRGEFKEKVAESA